MLSRRQRAILKEAIRLINQEIDHERSVAQRELAAPHPCIPGIQGAVDRIAEDLRAVHSLVCVLEQTQGLDVDPLDVFVGLADPLSRNNRGSVGEG